MRVNTDEKNSEYGHFLHSDTFEFKNGFITAWLFGFITTCLSHMKTSTAQKMKFSISDFFSKCDQIRSLLRIWSHLQKKSLMENFIFCRVLAEYEKNMRN